MKENWIFLLLCLSLFACQNPATQKNDFSTAPYVLVLGVAQDAGYPQAGCVKNCCRAYYEGRAERQLVSCLGIVDPQSQQIWMLDATPDFREQLHLLRQHVPEKNTPLDGILLTHAHIGHYTGLMQLGREVMGTRNVPVYAMPRMQAFLSENGPWGQLLHLKNIQLRSLQADSLIRLNERLQIRPFLVPHRDEYSETVGFEVVGPGKKLLFIPDIDKWERWERDISKEVERVDYALLDGTFFADGELPNRDMSQIPHPFVSESMARFGTLSEEERAKVFFIHLNHTNPLLQAGHAAHEEVIGQQMHVARTEQVFDL